MSAPATSPPEHADPDQGPDTPPTSRDALRALHSPAPVIPGPGHPRCAGELRSMGGKGKDRYQCLSCHKIHVRRGNLMERRVDQGCPFPTRDITRGQAPHSL